MKAGILVAGIGNIFLGDDGFGVETVRALLSGPLPARVTVKDFGIRGYDLAFALVDGYDAVIFVDAAPRGVAPGTVTLLALDAPQTAEKGGEAGGHSLDPVAALRLAGCFGPSPSRLYLVACEPAGLECDDGEMELSAPVRAAVPAAVEMILSLCRQLDCSDALQPGGPNPAAAKERNPHECLGHSGNRDWSAGVDRPDPDGAGNPPLSAHP